MVLENQDAVDDSERKKAILKHSKAKDHEDLGGLRGKLGQFDKDQNYGF
jgi:hypothetical protein